MNIIILFDFIRKRVLKNSFFVLCLYVNILNAQILNKSVEYKIVLNESQSSSKKEKMTLEQRTVYQNTVNQYNNIYINLIFNENLATVKTLNSLRMNNSLDLKIAIAKLTGGKDWFYDLENKIAKFLINYMGEKSSVKTDFQKYVWTITNDSKKINGFDCKKAISTYNYVNRNTNLPVSKPVEVWFTPSIPCIVAPNGYNGLPGLVLEINYEDFSIQATKIDLDSKEIIDLKYFEAKTVFETEADFSDMMKTKRLELQNKN